MTKKTIVERLEKEKEDLVELLKKTVMAENYHIHMKNQTSLEIKQIEKEIQDIEILIIYAKKL